MAYFYFKIGFYFDDLFMQVAQNLCFYFIVPSS